MDEPQEPGPAQLDTARAEELLDRMGVTLGRWSSAISLAILKRAALAREEAEDIWAEAQSLRRGDQG